MAGEGSPVPLGLLAVAGGLLVAAFLNERSKAATQAAAGAVDEVALHRAALAAVDQARAQIHLARRYADELKQHDVTFDVEAKLASVFAEPLPTPRPSTPSTPGRQPLLFMVDGHDRLPALKETVERYAAPSGAVGADDEPGSARAILRHAINTEGGLWSASRAYTLLTSHQWQSDSDRPENVVGNLLAAMVRDGEIKRAGRGMYTSTEPVAAGAEHEVAPGVLAREAAPGVWVITGLGDNTDTTAARAA
jgi:hypothetical protein